MRNQCQCKLTLLLLIISHRGKNIIPRTTWIFHKQSTPPDNDLTTCVSFLTWNANPWSWNAFRRCRWFWLVFGGHLAALECSLDVIFYLMSLSNMQLSHLVGIHVIWIKREGERARKKSQNKYHIWFIPCGKKTPIIYYICVFTVQSISVLQDRPTESSSVKLAHVLEHLLQLLTHM